MSCFAKRSVEILTPGQEYRLTLSADVDYLTDPETVYPVTIDPSLTVGYIVQGVNAIVDAPIYEGKPNSNYANYYYNRVGYYDDEYMTARTVMRLDALLSSDEWQSIDEEDITSLTLYIKESSGKSAKQVNIHALTENSTWTESTVKWSNVGAYSSTVYASATMGNDAWTEFDLTSLAKSWNTGAQNAQCGFLLKLADESVYRTFYSCEYSTIDYRPYVVLEYTEKLTMNYPTAAINKGSSLTLTATTQFGTPDVLTWTSSDSDVATVAGGAVSAREVGVATITATCTDADGTTLSASCTVYVKIPDGVYYIANAGSGLCLANYDSTVDSNSVYITNKNTTAVTQPTQFWQITYMEKGWYAIRPVDRPLAVLTASSNAVVVQDLASGATVQIKDRWQIVHEDSGYILKHKGLYALTAPTPNSAGSALQTVAQTTSTNCRWTLQAAHGVVLRDVTTTRSLPTPTIKFIEMGDTLTLADLGIDYDLYGVLRGKSWSPCDETVITTDTTTGTVTGISLGQTVITLSANLGGVQYSQSYTLICFNTVNLEVIYDYGYLAKYPDALSRINQHMSTMQEFYLNEFYIQVVFTAPQIFESYADTCPNPYNENCNCGDCYNLEGYKLDNIQVFDYHHKNYYNIAFRIPFPDISTTFKMAFTGHNVCVYNDYCYRDYFNLNPILGITFQNLGLSLITHDRAQATEIVTVVHEFGHFLGAIDHYGSGSSTTAQMNATYPGYNFEDDCMYGKDYFDNPDTKTELKICDGCKKLIQAKAAQTDHN